ncbi:MAG TPA: DUF3301 domain-containing protein [Burkholderiales bacterium]|nr:DUF3301 domain-containing protein [Burkholderiales bacterium]
MEFLGIALLAASAWLWFASLARRETAVDAARRACVAEGVQLLDDTVALESLAPRRDNGVLRLQRVYRFEFSDTGNNRLRGSITLLGAAVRALYLEPHRGVDEPPLLH